ncbi:hypothetical protein [Archangium sp.]|jgi:hypothetical protein|uniref:hypothetical protein n=1 Tax=Archangium sp. TaxID=1872627 RepID=UPI002EDB602F
MGSTALGQQDPRAVVVRPSPVAKAGDTRSPRALAPHAPATAKRYWADYAGKAIRRSNLDGSNVETLASDVNGPYGTSYDPETGYVLWTSSGDEKVQMAPANGYSAGSTTLNSSFEDYFAIVVRGSNSDTSYGVVNGQIIRLTRSHTSEYEQRDVLYTLASPDEVHGLALSPDNSALYLGDIQGRMTQKLSLSSLQKTSLVYDNSEPQPASSTAVHEEPARTREPSLVEPYPVSLSWTPESLSPRPEQTVTPRPSSTEETR